MKEVSIFDAKTHFSSIINEVYQHRESITITRRGIQIAKIVPFNERHTQDVMTLFHELDALSDEIGKVGLGAKEIKRMKEEGRR